jgi:lycopene cyclase domain-containing protein
MTYFGFLGLFLVLPILVLAVPARHRSLPRRAIPLLCLLALVYTTPWDNYLVATHVWWYDPRLVTGIVLGWVPVEEYTFFVLQPILVVLWIDLLIRSVLPTPSPGDVDERGAPWRWGAPALGGLAWLLGLGLLVSGWPPGTYLGLLLAWALIPILIQLAFGADILRRHARLVILGVMVPTLYLSAADALAIGWGTWTIDPAQSTGIHLGGLPIEEFVFFLLTNALVTFALVLIWAPESGPRFAAWRSGRRR